MTTIATRDLERELQNTQYRRYYGAAEARSELALALAEARPRLGLTKKELSRRSRVSQPYIPRLESGEANPTVGAVASILAVLNQRLSLSTAPLLPEPGAIKGDDEIPPESFQYKPRLRNG